MWPERGLSVFTLGFEKIDFVHWRPGSSWPLPLGSIRTGHSVTPRGPGPGPSRLPDHVLALAGFHPPPSSLHSPTLHFLCPRASSHLALGVMAQPSGAFQVMTPVRSLTPLKPHRGWFHYPSEHHRCSRIDADVGLAPPLQGRPPRPRVLACPSPGHLRRVANMEKVLHMGEERVIELRPSTGPCLGHDTAFMELGRRQGSAPGWRPLKTTAPGWRSGCLWRKRPWMEVLGSGSPGRLSLRAAFSPHEHLEPHSLPPVGCVSPAWVK